ncbi:unnamed protein product [Ectocarpus sp. 8 AP-2014]
MDDTFMHAASAGELMEFEVTTMCCTNTHPNIVRLVDVLASKSKIFAVMEWVGGGDLFDAIVPRRAGLKTRTWCTTTSGSFWTLSSTATPEEFAIETSSQKTF